MKISKSIVVPVLVIGIALGIAEPFRRSHGADARISLPPVILSGLSAYASGGPEVALNAWRKGGPLELDEKARGQLDDFKHLEKPFGNYKTYELIDSKEIGNRSKLLYLTLNFTRGAA